MNNLSFYIAVFMRRFHYFLLIFILTSAAAITMAVVLPPVFVSETQLLVESSTIPDELRAPTVQTGAIEELQIIEQRLMTRGNLLSVARSVNVFEEIDTMSVDDIVEAMRDATKIDLTAGRGLATIMGLGFASDNGEKSAGVVNQFVTLILEDSLSSRVNRASDTLKFFEEQVDRLGKELAIQSGIILDFQNENTGALPDTLSFRLTQQSVIQERLGSVERQIASLREQRRRLVEIFNKTGQVDSASVTPEQQRLSTLQDDLRRALAVYSTENPKVKLIEAQIAQQEAIVISQEGVVVSGNRTAPMTVLDINLADIDARVDLLLEQKQQIVVQLGILVTSIEKTAGNAIRLDAYNRDYTNTQQQYNNAVDSLSKAATGERIELLSKGQTIVVLDPPTAPQSPTSPNRKLIAAAGVLLGGGLGFAFVFLLEFLNNSIRRPSDIVNQMGITPIATVPYIRTPMELVLRRATIIGIFALVIVGVPAALFAVHQYYMPLDLIYEQIAEKLGDSI
ncbi:MAG: lipopolysaccharide biosynthesis protein [Paracoccaceae bacterium]